MSDVYDVVVIGGGQAGLAAGYYLRRANMRFIILDAGCAAGGAWRHTWDTLRLFSPARWSSLPGRLMPATTNIYPHRDDVLAYLADYEQRYALPIVRPLRVRSIADRGDLLEVCGADGTRFPTRAVISATGTWGNPRIPEIPGLPEFRGLSMHSAHYRNPLELSGQNILVVGGGNSGAQIMAEVSQVAAATTWVTLYEPRFFPADMDGSAIFQAATEAARARREGKPVRTGLDLGDIVQVPAVKEARARGVLAGVRPPQRFNAGGAVWADGTVRNFDAVLWCTGFRADLEHVRSLGIIDAAGRVNVRNCRCVQEPRVWFLGYGGWTGFASATLVGVGRVAQAVVRQIQEALTLPVDGNL